MNWLSLILNGAITGTMLLITAYFFKRWVEGIDVSIKELLDFQHEVDLKLEGLPNRFVTKDDHKDDIEHAMKSRENIWKELNAFKASMSDRMTKVETKIESVEKTCERTHVSDKEN